MISRSYVGKGYEEKSFVKMRYLSDVLVLRPSQPDLQLT